MASRDGGFGIGTLIFMGWVAYLFFGGDSDKKEKKVEKPKEEKPAIVETVNEHTKVMKDETKKILKDIQKSVDKAIEEFKKEEDKKVIAGQENKIKEEEPEEKIDEGLFKKL